MIYQDHYEECKGILQQIVNDCAVQFKEQLESKKIPVRQSTMTYEAYREGFDPDDYREKYVNQISSSESFLNLYDKLLSRRHTTSFDLFGEEINVDVKKELWRILNLSLMMSYTDRMPEFLTSEFKDLYFLLYEETFSMEITTSMRNLDMPAIELVNEKDVQIRSGRENVNGSNTNSYIMYKVVDSKKNKKNPLRQPQVIIDIGTGILRIYKNPKIKYDISKVSYSVGCPKLIQADNADLLLISYTRDYKIDSDGVQKLKYFFQAAYSSENKVRMAIRRFSIACGRESSYDKLLDFVFTLELLFGSGGPDSIKHKILIRLINLLSDKKEVRQSLYEKLSKLYSARNAIVHGLDDPNTVEIAVKNLLNYEEIIRKALFIFIEVMNAEMLSYDKMIKKLDYDKTVVHEIDNSSLNWIQL